MKQQVLVIVGPTASGKSDLAVTLAKRFDGEVISADSRQVYKGLDVGTGKITRNEMLGIPHHLLDVADPKKPFSAAEYKLLAEKKIEEIVYRGKLPIIVGGTGFYIDAVTGAITLPDVPPNPELRKKLDTKTTEALFKELRKKDPGRAKNIDPHNKVRLIRALEIVAKLGKVPVLSPCQGGDALQGRGGLSWVNPSRPPLRRGGGDSYEFTYIGLKPEKAVLEKRIHDRLLKRMPKMISEAKKLHANGLTWKRMEALGLEYRYLARFLQDKISKQEMTDELYTEIKKYAKRQATWFKRNKRIRWFTSAPSGRDADTILRRQAGSRRGR